MIQPAQQDPLFEAVRRLVLQTRNPSVAHVQRRFKLGYCRAAALIAALEGEIVTAMDESGWRNMLTGATVGRE